MFSLKISLDTRRVGFFMLALFVGQELSGCVIPLIFVIHGSDHGVSSLRTREELLFLSRVGVDEEVPEQEPEQYSMKADPPHKPSWIIALSEQQLERVDKDGNELYHLYACHVLFPP